MRIEVWPMDCLAARLSSTRLARVSARGGFWLLLLVATLAIGLAGCSSSGSSTSPASTNPTISGLSQNSGAVGSSITITGTNFGATQGTSTVTFNGTAATTITNWSATSIVVTVPAGATTGSVVVTVSGVASSPTNFVVPAIITGLSSASGAVGASVTITGTNFGATQGTSTVTFNLTPATVTSWSAISIVVTVPAAATTGNVVVTVSGVASNGSPFALVPAITSLSQTSGAVGASVTITGTSFGTTQGSSAVTFGGIAATATSWGATRITVTVPTGATNGNVVVTVGGSASNGVAFTVVLPPLISSLSQTSGAVGSSITITGTNFGTTQGSSIVAFNGASGTATIWSATSIIVTVPPTATTGNVVVTVLGTASNGSPFAVAPAITSLTQTSGAVGASVTIIGTSFGASQGSSTVAFGSTAATATSWGPTSITVTVPTGATTSNVVVTVGGFASNGVLFTIVQPPFITSLSQTSGSVGASITITGTNFGTTQGSSVVAFNGTSGTATSWSATSITVTVPPTATTGNVVVTVLSTASNGLLFTVAPTITTLSQASGAVGAPITITGTNFGSAQGGSTVTFNGTTATTVTSWSATSIAVNVPTGATTGNVLVTVGGQVSNGSLFTIVLAPTVTSLSPTSGAPGTSITITGTSFGTTQGSSTVAFNSIAATTVSSWSDTSITATVPTGASTGNVVVTVLGTASATSGSTLFTVTASCTSNCTLNGTVSGSWISGVTVTLSGGPTAGSTTTNASGAYSFTGLSAGSYTITPSLTGYTYSPSAPTVSINSATAQNFTAASAVTSYSVSGTLTYGGTKTGTVYIRVTNCGGGGNCSISAGTTTTLTSGSGSYTVRGLPSGTNYSVSAEIDTFGTGAQNDSNPEGSTTFSTSSPTGVNITIADRTPPSPVIPSLQSVSPSSGAVFISYKTPQDNTTGEEIATSYTISYGTDTNASNLGTVNFAAGNENGVYILSGLINTDTYYFKLAASNVIGGVTTTSAYSSISSPVTVNPSSGSNSVSGSVTFTGITPTGPLYVGLFSSTGVYFVSFPTPTSPQSFTIAGMPAGTYQLFAVLDQNQDHTITAGDITNFAGNNGPPGINVVSGANSGNNITLTAASATTFVATSNQLFGGVNSYGLTVGSNTGTKRPISLTLFSGKNVAVPYDITGDENNANFNPVYLNSISPTAGDTYQFLVNFSDGSTPQVISGTVTAVLTSFAQNLAMNSPVANTATVPELNWTAPASPPSFYTYSVGLSEPGGNENWNYSGGHNSNGLASGTTSVLFDVDGSAGPSSSLTVGTTYDWDVQVQDAYGNSAQITVTYNVP